MGDVVMFPMSYARFTKGKRTITLVWANSSNRIMDLLGEAPYSLMFKDSNLAMSRLLSSGWEEVDRGECR